MLKIKRLKSIRQRILLINLLIAVMLSVIIGIFLFVILYENMIAQAKRNAENQLVVYGRYIDNEILSFVNRSSNVAYNKYILNGLNSANRGEILEIVNVERYLQSLTNDISLAYPTSQVFSFYLEDYFGEGSKFFSPLSVVQGNAAAQMSLNSSFHEIIYQDYLMSDRSGNTYIVFYRNLTEIVGFSCLLEVWTPYRMVENHLSNLELLNSEVVLLHRSASGNVYSSRPAGEDADGGRLLSSFRSSDGSSLEMYIPYSFFIRQYMIIAAILTVVILMLAALVSFVTKITTRFITSGLDGFISDISADAGGNLLLREASQNDTEEVSIIKQKFIDLLQRRDEAYQKLMEFNMKNKDLEIRLQQASINPHLLYNSLTVMKAYAAKRRDKETMNIISSLSNYYRAALSGGADSITVAAEIAMLTEYVSVINYIKTTQYRLHVDIDGSIMERYIMKHLLQPLVENVVMHGFTGREEGNINISACVQGEDLIFTVRDDGVGMSGDELNSKYRAGPSERSGYGVKNVIERIHISYGNAYGLSADSQKDVGTSVFITIPELATRA